MLFKNKGNDSKKKILIADHDKLVMDVLKFNLEKDGYKTVEAYNGKQVIEVALTEKPDLVILEEKLAKVESELVCKKIKNKLKCQIIILIENNRDIYKSDIIIADDYIQKPFSIRELLVRVKANLRISATPKEINNEKKEMLDFKDLILDDARYVVIKNNRIIDFTFKEYEMLRLLVLNSGQVFERQEIIRRIWGLDYLGDVRSVDVTARRIREKIEDNPSEPKYLKTKKGIGYYVE